MTSEPKDLVLEQLRLLRGDFERMDSKLDDLTHKMGLMAPNAYAIMTHA